MPEAVKEGSKTGDVAAPEDGVVPSVDLATDGVVEVKPPPATEPSLPVDQVKPAETDANAEEVVEVAPEVNDPPTEQCGANKNDGQSSGESVSENKEPECNAEELKKMITKGRTLLFKRDCNGASEVLSKACEKASEIYGELSDDCVELYFLYGQAMLECGKTENNVLGENMKEKESEDDDDEDEGVGDAGAEEKEEEEEAMEVDQSAQPSEEPSTSNGAEPIKSKDSEDTTKEDEDDDSALKVAWEMFEMAKLVYERLDNKEKLADSLMKLGEVGIESGHPTAMDDMIKALDIRMELFSGKRIVPETHFNIGLGYSLFEMFDEAITHFEKSKTLLEEIVAKLENVGDETSLKEAKEIKGILPELKDKIQDMVDSKRDKRKEVEEILKNGLASVTKEDSFPAGASSSSDKPVSNITHLVKRKRKIDEVTSDLPCKTVEEPKRKVAAVEKEEEEKSSDEKKKNSDSINNSKSDESTSVDPVNEPEAMETEQAEKETKSEPEINSIVDNAKVKENEPVTASTENEQSPKEQNKPGVEKNCENEVSKTVDDKESPMEEDVQESDADTVSKKNDETLRPITKDNQKDKTNDSIVASAEKVDNSSLSPDQSESSNKETSVDKEEKMETTTSSEKIMDAKTENVDVKENHEKNVESENSKKTSESSLPTSSEMDSVKPVEPNSTEMDVEGKTTDKVVNSEVSSTVDTVQEKTEPMCASETKDKTELETVDTKTNETEGEKSESSEIKKQSESDKKIDNEVESAEVKDKITEVSEPSATKSEGTEAVSSTASSEDTSVVEKPVPPAVIEKSEPPTDVEKPESPAVIEKIETSKTESTVTNGCKKEDSVKNAKNLETAVAKEEATTVAC